MSKRLIGLVPIVIAISSCKPADSRIFQVVVEEAGLNSVSSIQKRVSLSNFKQTDTLSCRYSQLLNQVRNGSMPDEIFRTIENHEYDGLPKLKEEKQCKTQCSDLNINSIYESLLAKNLISSTQFNESAAKVMNKILHSMQTRLTPQDASKPDSEKTADTSKLDHVKKLSVKDAFTYSTDSWIGADKPEFPAIQLRNAIEKNRQKFPSKSLYLRHALGFNSSGDIDLNAPSNPVFQFDYLIYNAKNKDYLGIPKRYKLRRDDFFRSYLRKIRGYREDKPLAERVEYRTQYGISAVNVPQLEAPRGSEPWWHWGRDICINYPNTSQYAKSTQRQQIPVACGISGTTNIALWSVFASSAALSVDEVRTFLLLTWSVLSIDGGHSLQEVLTASKLIADYLSLFNSKNDLSSQISSVTLSSLETVTADIVAIDYKLSKRDPQLIQRIGSDILQGRKSSYFAKDWIPDSIEVPQSEMLLRREVEYYFSHAGKIKKDAKFGQYFDSFFHGISPDIFKPVRKKSQDELMQYHASSCLNESTVEEEKKGIYGH